MLKKDKRMLLYFGIAAVLFNFDLNKNSRPESFILEDSPKGRIIVSGDIRYKTINKIKRTVDAVFEDEKVFMPYLEIRVLEKSDNDGKIAKLEKQPGISPYQIYVSKEDARNALIGSNMGSKTNSNETLENIMALAAAHEAGHLIQSERCNPRMEKVKKYKNKYGLLLEDPVLEQEANDMANLALSRLYPNTPKLGYHKAQ